MFTQCSAHVLKLEKGMEDMQVHTWEESNNVVEPRINSDPPKRKEYIPLCQGSLCAGKA